MPIFDLTLLVRGLDPCDDAVLDALFSRTQDVTVGDRGEIAEVGFYLDAADARSAVLDAVSLVETTVSGSRVVQVDEDLVAQSDIAERLGCNTETVRLWATGQRGAGGFPTPRGHVGSHQIRVWRWADVHRWLRSNRPDVLPDGDQPIPSEVVDDVNANDLRRAVRAPTATV